MRCGHRLRDLRAARDLTARMVAHAAHVSPSLIRHRERGPVTFVSRGALLRIATVLQTTLADLTLPDERS